MAKTGLAQLPKAERKIATSEMSKRTRKIKADQAAMQMLNAGTGIVTSVVAAGIDHKFRKGAEGEARIGAQDPENPNKFRPSINGVIGTVGLIAGLAGAAYQKKWAGPVLAGASGFGYPAVYTFTRAQLAK
jgi:hypothetical protein